MIECVQLRVQRWARRFTDDVDAADDVAQEVLIDLDGRVRRYDGRSKVTTWLFTVTCNVALTQRRREGRRARLIAARPVDSIAAEPPPDDEGQLAALALTYFDALPQKQKIIFELCDLRGMRPADVARELGMEQPTVRAHLFKARRSIREKLLAHHAQALEDYRS
ncbi:MAG TPA: sigma-70 family RNA polymerase sigma factor [Gemmatimonadaceae bacterium]